MSESSEPIDFHEMIIKFFNVALDELKHADVGSDEWYYYWDILNTSKTYFERKAK